MASSRFRIPALSDRRNALPSEYLQRMALHISVFGSNLALEGVTISSKPSMIIGQPVGPSANRPA